MAEWLNDMTGLALQLVAEVGDVIRRVKPGEVEQLAEAIIRCRRLFLDGRGRSGLMMRAFAIRLTHLDIHCHVVGESTTPALRSGDLLLVGSGSGETITPLLAAQAAKKAGGTMAVLTARPQSAMAQLADLTVVIPAPVREENAAETAQTIQPMGSLFEQALLILLDTIVLLLKARLQRDEKMMMARHTNLE
ncbi:MAG TPA: 6-phospho-3-hexuloisomerase [Armatimonadota bacterium]|jgi:6-phospho-3-hexuloisomerase